MKKILILLVLMATICSCQDGTATKRKLQHQIIEEIALTDASFFYYSDYHIQHGDSASRAKCDSLSDRLHVLYTRFNVTMKE